MAEPKSIKIPVVSKKVKVSIPSTNTYFYRTQTPGQFHLSEVHVNYPAIQYSGLQNKASAVSWYVQQLYSWGWRCIVRLRWWASFVDLSLSGLPLLINHQSDPNITISRYRPCILQLSNHKGCWYDYQDSFQHDQVDHREWPRAKSRQYLTLYL